MTANAQEKDALVTPVHWKRGTALSNSMPTTLAKGSLSMARSRCALSKSQSSTQERPSENPQRWPFCLDGAILRWRKLHRKEIASSFAQDGCTRPLQRSWRTCAKNKFRSFGGILLLPGCLEGPFFFFFFFLEAGVLGRSRPNLASNLRVRCSVTNAPKISFAKNQFFGYFLSF